MAEMKPLTMSENDEREDRFAAKDKSGSGTCDPYRLECAWAEVDALRARVLELENRLAEAETAVGTQAIELTELEKEMDEAMKSVAMSVEDAVSDCTRFMQERNATRIALAASQAECAKYREALERISNAHADAAYSDDSQRLAVFNAAAGWTRAALSRSPGSMEALRDVVTRAVEEVDPDDFPPPPGVWVGDDGKETQESKDYRAAVAKMRAGIVDAVIGPAKPAEDK